MKFGVAFHTAYFGADPDAIAAYAQHAEACGFESFYMSEHIAMYKGAKLGGVALDPTVAFADPLEVLAFVAARTERILLGTAILQLPLHHPVMLAKRLATIDVLSKGRMRLLTVGLGALAGESAALSVDHATRGRRADEAIDILRLLWAGGENGVSFEGEFFSFSHAHSHPKPLRPGGVPIHVGGHSPASVRRAARRGDGWQPLGLWGDELGEALKRLHLEVESAGRERRAVELTISALSTQATPETLDKLAVLGVDRLVVTCAQADLAAARDEMSAVAARVGLSSPT